MQLEGKRALITGAGSGIGQRLAIEAAKRGVSLIIAGRRPEALNATLAKLPGNTHYAFNADVTRAEDRTALMDAVDQHWGGLDILVNNAGVVPIGALAQSTDEELEAAVATNLVAPISLTRQALPLLQRGVFASTVTIVGLTAKLPVNEDFPDNPITVYDLHKQMAEQYLKYFTRSAIVSGTILRLSNVYGPGPRSSRPDRGILNQMTKRAIEGKALTVYGEGNYLRDYVHVEDVVTAFLNAAVHIDALNGRHYVIGSGHGYTIKESMQLVADRVLLKTGRLVPIEHIEPPMPQSPIESRNFVADTSNFSGLTGWKTSYDLIRGVDQMIERLL